MKSFIVLAGLTAALAAPEQQQKTLSFSANINVNAKKTYQTMMGGGCSGAFGAACTTNTLSAADQQKVVETLFSENIGGLSILRNIIGSSRGATILPTCPATPSSAANYTSLAAINNDGCQLTLAQNALKYNPDLYIYADAWSAPGCFKTTGQESGGGYICGVRNTNCTYDWREAYADYLIEYVKLYHAQGIKPSLLGAYNEPDFNPLTYSAMESDGYQAYDFLSVLYPKVKKAFPHLAVSCCDSTGARQQRDLLYEMGRIAGGLKVFDVNTYHNYQSDVKEPFADLLRGQPTLETEWSDGGSTWVPTWDLQGQNFEGLQWAIYLHHAFVNNVAGFAAWWCTWTDGDAPLIQINGTSYKISARLWALAGYYRFARPGAMRVDATTSVPEIRVTAWQNTNGTMAIPVVNSAHETYQLSISVPNKMKTAVAYLSDNNHNVTASNTYSIKGGMLQADIEPRAMKTFFLSK